MSRAKLVFAVLALWAFASETRAEAQQPVDPPLVSEERAPIATEALPEGPRPGSPEYLRLRPTLALGGGILATNFHHQDYGYRDELSLRAARLSVGLRHVFGRLGSVHARLVLIAGPYTYDGQYPAPIEGTYLGLLASATFRLSPKAFYIGLGPALGVGHLTKLGTTPYVGGVAELGFFFGKARRFELGGRAEMMRGFLSLSGVLGWTFAR